MKLSKKLTRRHLTFFMLAVGMSSPFVVMANTTPAGNPIAVMDRISTITASDSATTKRVIYSNQKAQKAAFKKRAKARAARANAIKSANIAQEEAANFMNTQKLDLSPTPNTIQDSVKNPIVQSSVVLPRGERSEQSMSAPTSSPESLRKAVTTQPVSP